MKKKIPKDGLIIRKNPLQNRSDKLLQLNVVVREIKIIIMMMIAIAIVMIVTAMTYNNKKQKEQASTIFGQQLQRRSQAAKRNWC